MQVMNGYREQQSRQSGRSGRRSLASRGNASVQSVTPSAMDKSGRSRQSGLSAYQRLSVQPPVCGVQPGRVLELRTTLGLIRARAMLEQQIEQEQLMMDEGQKVGEKKGGQRLKYGRLKPLGVVSDPLLGSNSCLGIVSVNSRSSSHQRPRSCTAPEVHLSNSVPTSGDPHDTDGGQGKKAKVRNRSYSAMLPRNATVDQMRELTANMSITKQTALIPEGGTATNTTSEPIKTAHTIDSSTDKKKTAQTSATSQNSTSQLDSKEAQRSANSELDVDTVHTLTGNTVQILPPVVRQGELGMKIEVKRLRKFSDSVISETTGSAGVPADDEKQKSRTVAAAVNSRTVKRLPKLQEKEKKQAETLHHISPEMKERLKDGPPDQTLDVTTSSSSLRKVSIVSLGETPPKSQQTDVMSHRQHRRKQRHSEGKLVGSGTRLSQGWSPPQLETIEPIVGSPLHTPRKQSQTTGATAGDSRQAASRGTQREQGSMLELEALRSQMTSPGMFISVDVNEFLRDIDADINPA